MHGERETKSYYKKNSKTKRLKSSSVFDFPPLNNARDAVSRGVRNKPSTN